MAVAVTVRSYRVWWRSFSHCVCVARNYAFQIQAIRSFASVFILPSSLPVLLFIVYLQLSFPLFFFSFSFFLSFTSFLFFTPRLSSFFLFPYFSFLYHSCLFFPSIPSFVPSPPPPHSTFFPSSSYAPFSSFLLHLLFLSFSFCSSYYALLSSCSSPFLLVLFPFLILFLLHPAFF